MRKLLQALWPSLEFAIAMLGPVAAAAVLILVGILLERGGYIP